ncbi:MAG: Jag N-terminal domain-containing protein [Synergistaceae bacterium]|jgi:spoIIIJ-associated protein|nr:Jag N-terminal domain-containing protein [Synergistaceae bacterium]
MEQDTYLVFDTTSIEDALRQASAQWDVPAEELSAEVLSEEKSFFGLFGKKLKIRITPTKPLLLLKSCSFLTNVLERMGLRMAPELRDNYMISLEGQDANILVGRYGDGLKAMEYLLNLAFRSPGDDPRVRLDSGGYRERRKQSLERLAEATARRVVERGAPLRLDPMLSWERWVIHTTLKNRTDVETQSVGEAPDRKVVVLPKLGGEERQDSNRARKKNNSRYRGRR